MVQTKDFRPRAPNSEHHEGFNGMNCKISKEIIPVDQPPR